MSKLSYALFPVLWFLFYTVSYKLDLGINFFILFCLILTFYITTVDADYKVKPKDYPQVYYVGKGEEIVNFNINDIIQTVTLVNSTTGLYSYGNVYTDNLGYRTYSNSAKSTATLGNGSTFTMTFRNIDNRNSDYTYYVFRVDTNKVISNMDYAILLSTGTGPEKVLFTHEVVNRVPFYYLFFYNSKDADIHFKIVFEDLNDSFDVFLPAYTGQAIYTAEPSYI